MQIAVVLHWLVASIQKGKKEKDEQDMQVVAPGGIFFHLQRHAVSVNHVLAAQNT